ncbi:NAD(P)/FAD-dependent oxidoreductase [Dyadobacter sp. LHD-138]|uniref:NAD(P)/FAD-dependent oxidoreductase n=1 Tax=Dyadobacter sp. LHD-138 TaxID=3071413 RepID=UPI0027DEE74F|nr:NAD(P)/FAD-dependent oxidoreductase [Dyadobacter sp. LHD-138]MDQ6479088.1 NAD(P)/FAD-dependent oxidoreductase [Dyadobacter sp. LHD-138]
MRVIIVGGGFAGINLALSLAHNIKFQVTLVDKNSYNFFPPFLYQVASSFFEPSQISNPFLELFSGKENLTFHKGKLERVISAENKIILSDGSLEYDYLVLATGTEANFFGIKNIENHALPIKTMEDAMALRSRLMQQTEKVLKSKASEEVKKALTFVIAGGGSTGVEVAGMLANIKKDVLKYSYSGLQGTACEIYLVQKDPVLLPLMPEISRLDAYRYLHDLGVKILLNTHVKDFVNDEVLLSSGAVIHTENLVWTAGTQGRMLKGLPGNIYGTDNRILVDGYNKVVGTYNIFAIGDMCLETDAPGYPDGHPQVAQVAIQQGENLAKNFQLMAEHRELEKFVYKDPGFSIITGKMSAVMGWNRFNIHLAGKLAWFMNMIVHWRPMTRHTNRYKMFYYGVRSYLFKSQFFRRM